MFGGTRGIVEARYAGLELKEKAYQDALRHLDESTRHLGEASTLLRTSIEDKRTRDDRRQDKRAYPQQQWPIMTIPGYGADQYGVYIPQFGAEDEDDLLDEEDFGVYIPRFGAQVDDQAYERVLHHLDEATSLLRSNGQVDKRTRDTRQQDRRTYGPGATFGPMTIPGYGADQYGRDDEDEDLDDEVLFRDSRRAARAKSRFERSLVRDVGRLDRRLTRSMDRLEDRSGMTDDEVDDYLDSIDIDLDEEFGNAFTDQIADIENQVVGIVKKYVSMLKVPSLLSYNRQRDAVIDQGKSSNSPEAVALEKKGLGLLSGVTQPAAAQLWTLARQRDNLRRQVAGRAPEPIGAPPRLV